MVNTSPSVTLITFIVKYNAHTETIYIYYFAWSFFNTQMVSTYMCSDRKLGKKTAGYVPPYQIHVWHNSSTTLEKNHYILVRMCKVDGLLFLT